MSRNSSGTYTLPAGNPVVTSTTISTTWANTTLGDIATEITDSASRSGKGGFTAPIRVANGTVAAPSFSYTSEPGTGQYLAGTGDLRVAVGGVDALKLGATTVLIVPIAGGYVLLQGNQAATQVSTGANPADVVLASTATRTAGFIAQIQNPSGTGKLGIDYQGLLQLQNTAALQPASIVTAITPGGGWGAAGSGLGYWKDATGLVHMRGTATWLTGATTLITLPVGFRPANNRQFPVLNFSSGALMWASVTAAGAVSLSVGAPSNNDVMYFDAVRFLAEQ